MPSSTVKRVILYRFDRQPFEAIVSPAGYLQEHQVELITPNGTLQNVRYDDLKALCFVSETGAADLFIEHNLFERRPKVPGLWTRFSFRDGDRLDGILSHNLLDWPQMGYFITPPRAGAARQRVFIPRVAVIKTELRGVVGTSSPAPSGRRRSGAARDEDQLKMFES